MNDFKTEVCPYCGYGIGDWVLVEHMVKCPKNPWTYITNDPVTLPPFGGYVLLSILDQSGFTEVIRASYEPYGSRVRWYDSHNDWVGEEYGSRPYAWMPWPDPAPYPGE